MLTSLTRLTCYFPISHKKKKKKSNLYRRINIIHKFKCHSNASITRLDAVNRLEIGSAVGTKRHRLRNPFSRLFSFFFLRSRFSAATLPRIEKITHRSIADTPNRRLRGLNCKLNPQCKRRSLRTHNNVMN